jgi:hypothetical protein
MQNELDNYLSGKSAFNPYFEGMNVLTSNLYKKQLQEIVVLLKKEDENSAKYFTMYLDTIIINMHTKAKKYKQSVYFDNEYVKDIENQGYTIPFYLDESKKIYVLLGILKNSEG